VPLPLTPLSTSLTFNRLPSLTFNKNPVCIFFRQDITSRSTDRQNQSIISRTDPKFATPAKKLRQKHEEILKNSSRKKKALKTFPTKFTYDYQYSDSFFSLEQSSDGENTCLIIFFFIQKENNWFFSSIGVKVAHVYPLNFRPCYERSEVIV
jgi:hypothetical protein